MAQPACVVHGCGHVCIHQYTIGGVTTRAVSDFLTHVNLLERTVNREWASAGVREEKKRHWAFGLGWASQPIKLIKQGADGATIIIFSILL